MGCFFSYANSDLNILIIENNEIIQNLNPKVKEIIFYNKNFDLCSKSKILLEDNLTVETINFIKCDYYDLELNKLPKNLKNLYLPDSYKEKIQNFPTKLEKIMCSGKFYYINNNNIPRSLKILHIIRHPLEKPKHISLPENLIELHFCENYYDFNDEEYMEGMKKIFNNLPEKLKIIKLPYYWNTPLNNLPNELEKIFINKEYLQNLDMLPNSIKYLEFSEKPSYNLNILLDNLPTNLQYLNLHILNEYTHSLANLPDSIKHLVVGPYKLKIDKLPKNLEFLEIESLVKFRLIKCVDYEKDEIIIIKYYELLNIGKYNIENEIYVDIPSNLKSIIWYDNNYLFYEFIKIKNTNLWVDKSVYEKIGNKICEFV